MKRVEVWINGALKSVWYQDERSEVSSEHVDKLLAGREVKSYSHRWIDGDVYRCDTWRIDIQTTDYDPDGLKEPGRQTCAHSCSCWYENGKKIADEWGPELSTRIDVLTTGVEAACKQADKEVEKLSKNVDAIWRCLREDARDRFQLGKRIDVLERKPQGYDIDEELQMTDPMAAILTVALFIAILGAGFMVAVELNNISAALREHNVREHAKNERELH